MTGIDFEKANWQARLNNLSSFVSSWNALQAKMTNTTASSGGGGGGSVSAPSMPSGSVTPSGGGVVSDKTKALQKFMYKQFGLSTNLLGIWDAQTTEAVKQMQKRIGLTSPNGLYNKPTYIALTKYMNRVVGSAGDVPAYASGVASVGENQIALVQVMQRSKFNIHEDLLICLGDYERLS